jgi:ABC-type sugar transport system permease subunit
MKESPGKGHYLIAGLFAGMLALVVGLAVTRYIEYGRELRLSLYRGLTTSMGLAAGVQGTRRTEGSGGDREALARLQTRADELLHQDDRVVRAFFLRKGESVAGFEFSRPARFELDRRTGVEMHTREKLETLVARLDDDVRRGDRSHFWRPQTLSWFHTEGGETRVVANWPVFVGAEFSGIVGIEMLPVRHGPVLLWYGLGCLLLAALLFHVALRRAALVPPSKGSPPNRFCPRSALVASFLPAVLLGSALLFGHWVKTSAEFAFQRDRASTVLVNQLLARQPDLLSHVNAQWEDTFRESASGVSVVSTGSNATVAGDLRADAAVSSGTDPSAVVVWEDSGELARLAVEGLWPPVVLVLVVLLLGLYWLPGLAQLVWGIHRMPGAYAYVAPAMIGMLVLVLVPFVMGIALGFVDKDLRFVGFENFQDILFPTQAGHTNFYFTLGVTVLWTVSNVVLHVVIGLAMALVLIKPAVRWKGLWRVLLIVPWAVPNYITALVWKWMFTSEIGAISILCQSLGIGPDNWLGNSFWTNYFANLATNVWLGFPFMMVVSMGALQSIPAELYEAAEVDGANRWQKFRSITLPLLKPALFPAVILGSIWTFNMFNVIFLVSQGNPSNQTNILITEAYRFFKELNQYGVAAAYCVIIFIILLLYTLVTNRVTKATKGAFE